MRFRGISGTWRVTTPEVEADVRKDVQDACASGMGIVTGGALGVDYYATEEAFAFDPSGAHVRVVLPTTLTTYSARLTTYATENPEERSAREVGKLLPLLETIQKIAPASLIEGEPMGEDKLTEEVYFARNSAIVELSDELMAFQVNNSRGTEDTVLKARKKGIPVSVKAYTV